MHIALLVVLTCARRPHARSRRARRRHDQAPRRPPALRGRGRAARSSAGAAYTARRRLRPRRALRNSRRRERLHPDDQQQRRHLVRPRLLHYGGCYSAGSTARARLPPLSGRRCSGTSSLSQHWSVFGEPGLFIYHGLSPTVRLRPQRPDVPVQRPTTTGILPGLLRWAGATTSTTRRRSRCASASRRSRSASRSSPDRQGGWRQAAPGPQRAVPECSPERRRRPNGAAGRVRLRVETG